MQGSPHVLTFPASLEGFETAFRDLSDWLQDAGTKPKVQYNAELVFEEIVTNIVRYGFADPAGETVAVELTPGEASLVMTFDDGGVAFDPLAKPDPELPHSIDEAKIGGLGIMLVRKAASALSYERTPAGRNRLTVAIATD